MKDFYRFLDEPRRPWIDEEFLKTKFLAACRQLHPDLVPAPSEAGAQSPSQVFSELNEAYATLRNPSQRIRHLLELERGAKSAEIQRLPAGIGALHTEIGGLIREVDSFLHARATTASPLTRVRYVEAGLVWRDRLRATQTKIEGVRADLFTEMKSMNILWERAASEPPTRESQLPLDRLEEIYRVLCYVSRWTAQMRERAASLGP